MKPFNKTFAFLLLTTAFCSCKKYLDQNPISNQSTNTFFKNESDIDQALTGVYNSLLGFPDVNNYNLSECHTNNYYLSSVDAQRDYYSINHFEVNPQLAMLETSWTNSYRLIGRANQILDVIDDITFLDDTKKQREKAEAKFLRAYAYFELVKLFGGVPLIDHKVSSTEVLNYPRVAADTIYNFIFSELQSAADALPYKYATASDKGRVTKLSALGLLGKAHMFVAGYPFNKTEHFTTAKTILKQVLDQETVNWTFAPTYAELFKAANDNKYHLFEVQHIAGNLGYGSPIPGEVVPTDMTTTLLPYGSYYIGGAPSRDLINSYEPGDKRMFATIDTLYRNKSNAWVRRDWVRKFLDSSVAATTKSNSDWPVNFPLLRSEDVMLLYAEAVNETSGPTAEAVAILNRIRTRAGLPATKPATADDFRLAMEQERRHEFAWEGIYWFDLVRTNRYLDVLNPYLSKNYQKTIDAKKYVYPIPQAEMNIKPGLYEQNDGYN
jgi:starch-binding outer membrane protein, SusD/RagB family